MDVGFGPLDPFETLLLDSSKYLPGVLGQKVVAQSRGNLAALPRAMSSVPL